MSAHDYIVINGLFYQMSPWWTPERRRPVDTVQFSQSIKRVWGGCDEKEGGRMKTIGQMMLDEEGWVVPWAVRMDDDGDYWARADYSVHERPHGTASMYVRRGMGGLLVRLAVDYAWRPEKVDHFAYLAVVGILNKVSKHKTKGDLEMPTFDEIVLQDMRRADTGHWANTDAKLAHQYITKAYEKFCRVHELEPVRQMHGAIKDSLFHSSRDLRWFDDQLQLASNRDTGDDPCQEEK